MVVVSIQIDINHSDSAFERISETGLEWMESENIMEGRLGRTSCVQSAIVMTQGGCLPSFDAANCINLDTTSSIDKLR
jgi:hypothetical protein